MSVCIRGIGTAVPRHWIAQDDAAQAASQLCGLTDKQRRLVPALYRHAGVRKRHSVVLAGGESGADQTFYRSADDANAEGPSTAERMRVYGEAATPLAAEAGHRALLAGQTEPSEITHLVTASCSGFCAPGVDVQLIGALGLDPGVARTHIGFMGCHAALNALRVARAFTDADAAARVLVCAVELCSLHHQYGWHPEQIVANALFADGAAAAVCARDLPESEPPGLVRSLSSASIIVPDTLDLMSWRIGDHGFEMGLSPRVPEVICSSLRTWLEAWLGKQRVRVDQVGAWAIHPGGPRILQACVEALELDGDALAASKGVLAEYGNMSSPTILFIVDRLVRQHAAGPWVLLAFGPGLTIEAALVEPLLDSSTPRAAPGTAAALSARQPLFSAPQTDRH